MVARLQRWAERPEAPPRARARLLEVYLTIGWYDDAQRLCEAWLEERPAERWALLGRALLARAREDWPTAETYARRALAQAVHFLPARVVLVEALLAQGCRREAAQEAGAFPQRLAGLIDPARKQVREDVPPEVLLEVARGCALYGVAAGRPQALKLAVQDLYPEARRRDPQQVRAYLEPARLLLAKYNVQEARQLYLQALEINPNHPEAHLGLALCRWQAGDPAGARAEARRALAVNPHHPGAHCLLTRIDFSAGRPQDARRHVEAALAVSPSCGEAWALRMLLRLAEGSLGEDFPQELATLPPPAQARVYRELADWLSDRRRYEEAELQYRRALLVQPDEPGATAGLGLCYFRWGKEDEARNALEKAFQLDSFNVRVYNALEVLDFLARTREVRRGHLRVRVPEGRGLLADYIVSLGGEVLARLRAEFGLGGEGGEVTVEVFPREDLFSARVVGLTGLDLDGACLGSVVALRGPADGAGALGRRPFNWYRVLVHELTHAVCYQVAGGRAPQWLQEGLALWFEGGASPRGWLLVLVDACEKDGLRSLGDLERAFVSKPGSAERALAYAQSALAVRFLVERFGWETVLSLLKEAKRSPRWAEAVRAALGVEPQELEARYRRYLERYCRDLRARMALATVSAEEAAGAAPLSDASRSALVGLLREEPGALDGSALRELAGRVSEPALREEAMRALLRLEPTDLETALALAEVLLRSGRTAEAAEAARVALGAAWRDPRVHVLLAQVSLAAGERSSAVREARAAWTALEERGQPLRAAARGEAWRGLSRVLAALGEEERARQARLRADALLGKESERREDEPGGSR